MNAITLGNPNLFVKGIAEQTFIDPQTGNIVGFDNVASESAVTSSVNLQEITGGFGNAVVGVIPDSTRLTGSYTSQAFSLETRRLITGGVLAYNAVAPVCETIVANGTTLTVSRTAEKHYGQPASDTEAWCYVKEQGASQYAGTNYGIDIATGNVTGFTATSGKTYEVYYFAHNASALSLAIPESFNPVNVTVQEKFGVYAKQNNGVSGGTLQGWLYIVVPVAILNGDAGINGNQTSNATTDGSWMALSPDKSGFVCDDCSSTSSALAYYVYVPCGDATANVEALAVTGGGVTVAVNQTAQLPVKYVMPNDSLVQPTYTDLTYVSGTPAKATVDTNGVVTGVATGDSIITVTLTKADGTTLTASAVAHVVSA